MRPNLAPCSAFAAPRPALLRRTSLRACGSSALCSAFAAHRFAPAAAPRSALLLPRIASRLRQLCVLFCSLPRIASRLRQQASGAVRPFGAIPPTSLRSRAPPAHGAAGGYAVRRLAAIRRFRSRISPTSFLRERKLPFRSQCFADFASGSAGLSFPSSFDLQRKLMIIRFFRILRKAKSHP